MSGAPVDYDLGGVVRLRLLDAGGRERAAVGRQLGPLESPGDGRAPDVVVRFVDRLELHGDLRYVGLDDAGFTDEEFLILRGKHKSRVRARVPVERIGATCEIECERGLAAVPMLVPILNATMLARGHLPLHAAAFVHRGRGVIATGWSKGGKTETLLAFLGRGARYVADEWLYLAPDGARMFGIPEPIRVWGWHVDSLPELRARLTAGERARLSLLGLVAGGMQRVTDHGRRHGSAATRTLNRASALLESQRCLDVAPERLFAGLDAVRAGGEPVRPECLLFVVSHERPDIVIEPVEAAQVAARMRFSLAEEDQRLRSLYHRFRFAFPGRANPHLEAADERRAALLASALGALPAFEVRHPYPVSLPALYAAVAEVLERPW